MSEQMSRRQVYAFVALAELPPLEGVRFVGDSGLHLDPGDNVDPGPWIRLLGGDPATVRRNRYDHSGRTGYIVSTDFDWAGYRVHMQTYEDLPPAPVDAELDEQTVEQLRAIAAGEDLVDQALTPPAGATPLAMVLGPDTELVVE